MAGEWIPIDCNLATKPEVLELVEVTGQPVEVVFFRLFSLWSWASMNTADGIVRATPRRLAAVAGGDGPFWEAVAAVGWLRFGEDGTVEIVGWEKRFSQAAKARAENARRACAYRAQKAHAERTQGARKAHDPRTNGARKAHGGAHVARTNRAPEERRGEDKTGEDNTPSGGVCGAETHTHTEPFAETSAGTPHGIWEDFRQAWNATPHTKPYNALGCPSEALGLVTDPGFQSGYRDALARLGGSSFFTEPAALTWFLRNWSRVLAGEFDSRGARGPAKAAPRVFQLEDNG